MNPMLQRHCAKFIYIIPEGLRELMSDISREVIRSQPNQIYIFIADYLDALMLTRENARVAARLVETICEIAESTVEILVRIGLSRSEADHVCQIIQNAFREHLERKKHPEKEAGEEEEDLPDFDEITMRILSQLHIEQEKLEEIVKIIQNAWRKFKERKDREKQLLFGMVDWRIAARSAIALYRKTGVTRYEANRAATLIKAAYKGYYTRRIMKRLLQKGLEEEITIDSEIEGEESNEDFFNEEMTVELQESTLPVGYTGYTGVTDYTYTTGALYDGHEGSSAIRTDQQLTDEIRRMHEMSAVDEMQSFSVPFEATSQPTTIEAPLSPIEEQSPEDYLPEAVSPDEETMSPEIPPEIPPEETISPEIPPEKTVSPEEVVESRVSSPKIDEQVPFESPGVETTPEEAVATPEAVEQPVEEAPVAAEQEVSPGGELEPDE